MPDQALQTLSDDTGVNISLLALVRWVALAGQFLAIISVYFVVGFDLPLGACLSVVALSGLVGFWQAFNTSYNRQLTGQKTLLLLSFDTVQLAALLYLTGGLANPFSVLMIAPVTVSAMVLRPRQTAFLVMLVSALASILVFQHYPLPWSADGFTLPPLYLLGLWMALLLTTIFVAAYAGSLANESRKLARGLAEARLTLEREHKMVSLGSLATAAAHKLGSPLNTITLIAHELERYSAGPKSGEEQAHFQEDIVQLKEETERCRAILAELNEDAIQLGHESEDPVAISAFIRNLMETRFSDISDVLHIKVVNTETAPEPLVTRRPELIHPVETLVDNAAQFAVTEVEILISWTEGEFTISVRDDGPGFQSAVLSRLGDPYASSRTGVDGHMGLGVFIAMTMVSHVGGNMSIGNRKTGGAEAVLTYPRQGFDFHAVNDEY